MVSKFLVLHLTVTVPARITSVTEGTTLMCMPLMHVLDGAPRQLSLQAQAEYGHALFDCFRHTWNTLTLCRDASGNLLTLDTVRDAPLHKGC